MKKPLPLVPRYDKSGYFTLISVIIIGSILTSIVVTITFLGIDQTKNSINMYDLAKSWSLANTCAEEGLQQIRDNASFSGVESFNLNSGSCNYSVANNGGGNYRITATGLAKDSIRKIEVIINQRVPKINIVSWQEVDNF